jgi:hypothetical protein
MKITIDEIVFNKAIQQGKLEVAQWLLEQGCSVDSTAYVQNFNEIVLQWLYSKNIPMSKTVLSHVISNTGDISIINWFIKNGAIVDNSSLISAISNNRNELFWELFKKKNIILGVEACKAAVMAENIEILNHLKIINAPFEESVTEIAMKFKKKTSLKWLVSNDLF